MSNLRELPLRELGRGLMRGDRADLKVGYTAANATIAARRLHELSESEAALLEAYLDGFSAGMRREPVEPEDVGLHGVCATAYKEGVADGLAEPTQCTNPGDPAHNHAVGSRQRKESR
jgi:hypothetical protein